MSATLLKFINSHFKSLTKHLCANFLTYLCPIKKGGQLFWAHKMVEKGFKEYDTSDLLSNIIYCWQK